MNMVSTPSTELHASTKAAVEDNSSAVSWAAILAGTLLAAAVSLILLAVGSGIGLSVVSPWPGTGATATTFTVFTAIWLIVVQWVASGLGGYLTGRLRSRWVSVHSHEIFFRDTAHGLLTWALAAVVGATLLASTISSAMGNGARAAIGGGIASTPDPYDVDALFRSARPAPNDSGANPIAGFNPSAEASRILGKALEGSNTAMADRDYLTQLVVAKTGLSQAEAQQRVDTVTIQARQAADVARKGSALLSLYVALSMLVGAFVAGVAAAIGGRVRDRQV
jgi:hypothetical protein